MGAKGEQDGSGQLSNKAVPETPNDLLSRTSRAVTSAFPTMIRLCVPSALPWWLLFFLFVTLSQPGLGKTFRKDCPQQFIWWVLPFSCRVSPFRPGVLAPCSLVESPSPGCSVWGLWLLPRVPGAARWVVRRGFVCSYFWCQINPFSM